ncbi:proliferating cell nuclear antigen [Olea europaea subsp. europaea]|uniref:DNA sliding clamp PCNA n=1 Tax=Olea europaea subsp. europaea TaxID=158383 RepID=A0A8S0RL36_OLEEU|nr:proliferating cell nuclear antigen [Olea europaea subsp. europaea]
MLELRLVQGSMLKKVLKSIKDLVNEANFDCSMTGFSLQAMDSSHVALEVLLRYEGFEHYGCDRNLPMWMNLGNMTKMLKCAENDDIVTIEVDDGSDTVTFTFESPTQDKILDFVMKLMDIDSDSEHLGIPEAKMTPSPPLRPPEFFLVNIVWILPPASHVLLIYCWVSDDLFSNMLLEDATIIEMNEPVSLTFSLRYLNSVTKATPLSNMVTISLSSELPVVVEYKIAEMGYIRFYFAPKIEEDDEDIKP